MACFGLFFLFTIGFFCNKTRFFFHIKRGLFPSPRRGGHEAAVRREGGEEHRARMALTTRSDETSSWCLDRPENHRENNKKTQISRFSSLSPPNFSQGFPFFAHLFTSKILSSAFWRLPKNFLVSASATFESFTSGKLSSVDIRKSKPIAHSYRTLHRLLLPTLAPAVPAPPLGSWGADKIRKQSPVLVSQMRAVPRFWEAPGNELREVTKLGAAPHLRSTIWCVCFNSTPVFEGKTNPF